MKTLLAALGAAMLIGCVTTPRPQLAVSVDAPPDKVRTVAVTHLVDDGWTPLSGDNLVMTFQKDMPFAAQMFLQELGGQPARHQFGLTILPSEYGARMVATLSTITTHFGNPQRHENRQQDARVLWVLNCIRAKTMGEPLPPEPPPPPRMQTPRQEISRSVPR